MYKAPHIAGQDRLQVDWTTSANVPEKLSQVQVKFCGSSDHRLILATRYAKNLRQNIRYCKKRSYKRQLGHLYLETDQEVNCALSLPHPELVSDDQQVSNKVDDSKGCPFI